MQLDYSTFDALGGLVVVVAPDDTIVHWNGACVKLTGMDAAEVRGTPFERIVSVAEGGRDLAQYLSDVRAGAPIPAFIGWWKLPTGGNRVVSLAGSAPNLAGVAEDLVVLAGADITEASERYRSDVTGQRTALERSLLASEQRLKVALQASPTVVFNQDRDLRYTWIYNPKAPYSAEDVVGRTDYDLLSFEEAEELTRIKGGVLETGRGVRTVVRTTIGEKTYHFDLTVEPLTDELGQVTGITCASWDITERCRAETRQRLLAEVGELLMKASLDISATLAQIARLMSRDLADWVLLDLVETDVERLTVVGPDPDGQDLAYALERVELERSRPHLMHHPLVVQEPLLMEEVPYGYIESIAQGPEHLKMLRRLDMRSLISAPLIARGRLVGAIAIIATGDSPTYDRSDLALVEAICRVAALALDNARLYESAQLAIAAHERIVGIVAHDLRQPLHLINLHAHLLRAHSSGLAPETERSLELIGRSVSRMERLIGDMVDVALIDAAYLTIDPAPVDPNTLLEEAVDGHRRLAAAAELELRLELTEPLPLLVADRDRLLQVFDNLIGNAVKFTPPGGAIVVGGQAHGRELLFWVRDTGPGIPPELLPHVFDRFWQASGSDRRGAGLGLAIVEGVVTAHGGRAWAESELGQGTTFYVALPI